MDFRLRHLILPIILLAISKLSFAVNLNYSIDGGVGYSDNITRAETDPVKDSVRFIGGSLSVVDQSSTNDLNLVMDVAYRDFREDSFEDDVVANISLASNFSLIDDSLSWTLDGFYGQQGINPFAVTTPDNLQDTGLLSTGPNLLFNFTSVDSLLLEYRYNNFYAEITDVDYQSNVFRTVLARRFSPRHTLSFNISHEDLKYDNPSNANFKSLEHTLAINGATTNNQYSIEWGVVDVDFEDGRSGDADVYRLLFSRNMNSFNNFALQLSRTLDNGGSAVTGTIPGIVTTGLFLNDFAQLSYSYSRGSISLDLSSVYSDREYVDPAQSALNQKILSNSIAVVYGTPLNLQTSLRYTHLNRDFYDVPQVDSDNTITLSVEKQIARNINIVGAFVNFSRESKTQVETTDIEENRIIVTLRYLGRI